MAKLLLIDDDEGTLTWMSAALEAAGHEVRAANGAAAGLALLRAWTPDLIISDIMMPEMSGLDFSRLAQRLKDTPILFVSIAAREAEAILCGAVGYVQKPLTAEEVRAAVERVLGHGAQKNTILVVDDEDYVREIYRELLEPRFTVLEAEHGRAALEALEAHPVSLIISDVQMPVMNGVEFIRAVRRDPRWQDLPIIVQTGDMSVLHAPVWVDLRVSQTIAKDKFMQWLFSQIEERVPTALHPD